MPDLVLAIGIATSVFVLAIVAYVIALRTRHHYTSRLTCPRCKGSFDYDWVPLASFSAVRLGRSRYLRCPLCGEWSTFNVWDARTIAVASPGG